MSKHLLVNIKYLHHNSLPSTSSNFSSSKTYRKISCKKPVPYITITSCTLTTIHNSKFPQQSSHIFIKFNNLTLLLSSLLPTITSRQIKTNSILFQYLIGHTTRYPKHLQI